MYICTYINILHHCIPRCFPPPYHPSDLLLPDANESSDRLKNKTGLNREENVVYQYYLNKEKVI